MIKLSHVDVDDLDLVKSYEILAKKRKYKADMFRFVKDKKLSYGAYLLLKKLLDEENITEPAFKVKNLALKMIKIILNLIYFMLTNKLASYSKYNVKSPVKYMTCDLYPR